MKLLVIIPAYNEQDSLPGVLADLAGTCPEYDLLVVNDGSTDTTADVCRSLGCNLLDLPVNLGLSGAFQAGIFYAAEKGYDAAIQFDADGQHRPEYIRPMAEKLAEGYDIVIGSRFINGKKNKSLRVLGSHFISGAIRLTAKCHITDPTSGMRIFNRAMIEKFAYQLNFAPEPDTISYVIHCGASVCEVPVEMDERTAGTSYLNLSHSLRYMAEMTVSILLIQWFRKKDTI